MFDTGFLNVNLLCSDVTGIFPKTDLLLLWRLVGGVGHPSVWLDPLCCRTAAVAVPVPLCSDWAWYCWLCWLAWPLWELKHTPSSRSDWAKPDSGVSASGGSEISSGDAHSYSSLDSESSVITSCCWSSPSNRSPADPPWVKSTEYKTDESLLVIQYVLLTDWGTSRFLHFVQFLVQTYLTCLIYVWLKFFVIEEVRIWAKLWQNRNVEQKVLENSGQFQFQTPEFIKRISTLFLVLH